MTNPVIAPYFKISCFQMGNDLGYYEDKKLKSAKKKSVAIKMIVHLKSHIALTYLKVEIGLVIKKIYSIEN